MHQQPDRPLPEPVAHQGPFTGVDGLLDQASRGCDAPGRPLRGEQQLAGGALGVGGREHVMQAGAEAQQQLARAEAACVEVDLAAHGHPVSFVCERSCFFAGF